jgi:hypothetical protein
VSLEMIVAIVVLIAIVAVAAWWLGQRRRTDRLRERFGPEYERTVDVAEDRGRAESELEARQQRVDSLDIRPLSGPDRARFGERWRVIQALFVDDPTMAVDQADTLIGEVMRARGYPVGDFEQRAADISVDHPQVVDHYRTAHRIAQRRIAGAIDTEELRQAFVHYRALFGELLETGASREETRAPQGVMDTTDAAAKPIWRVEEPVAETPAEPVEAAPPAAAAEPAAASDPVAQAESVEPAEPARRP